MKLHAVPNKTILRADGEDLSYIMVNLVDQYQHSNLFLKKEISVMVKGEAVLQGYGSANPSCMGSYDDTVWETYDGYVLAIIRAKENSGKAVVKFSAEGCNDCSVELVIK